MNKKFDIDEVKRLTQMYIDDPDNIDPDNQKVAVDILAWSMLYNKRQDECEKEGF